MKLVALFALVSYTLADVSHILGSSKSYVGPVSKSAILRHEQEIKPDGSYKYYYETANGIVGHEDGDPVLTALSGTSVSGGYHYTSPDGKLIVVSYVANENGFQPSRDVPLVPPAV